MLLDKNITFKVLSKYGNTTQFNKLLFLMLSTYNRIKEEIYQVFIS